MEDYKDLTKQFNKNKRKESLDRIKGKLNKLNFYTKIKNNYLLKTNKAPDISTITEHIAFVIDGKVVEIIHCQPKMAAILLSEPEIIQIPEGTLVKPGWTYEDNKFIDLKGKEITVERDREAIEQNLPTFKEFQQNLKEGSLPTFKEYIEKVLEVK